MLFEKAISRISQRLLLASACWDNAPVASRNCDLGPQFCCQSSFFIWLLGSNIILLFECVLGHHVTRCPRPLLHFVQQAVAAIKVLNIHLQAAVIKFQVSSKESCLLLCRTKIVVKTS